MNKEKQIEERQDLSDIIFWSGYGFDKGTCNDIAKQIQEQGYRKSSDVAREIFEEIEKSIADLEYQANTPRKTVKVEELKAQVNWVLHEVVPKTLAELKKKYTESEKDK